MQFRERQQESPAENAGVPGPSEPNSQLDSIRAEGSAFLAAGNAIIDAALSGDSQAFLQANRQQGGQ
ncbi:MAG: hypothetical protein QOF48_1719 [Verrucomicrobiota bacterium]|jgi:hypothetical protein